MPDWEWREAYQTGHAGIDAQHQQLFEAVARIHAAVSQGLGGEETGPLLDFLVEYARKHFAYEEALMRACRFPHLEEHITRHRTLVADLSRTLIEVELRATALEQRLMPFLRAWLERHILEEDLRLAAFLQDGHAG